MTESRDGTRQHRVQEILALADVFLLLECHHCAMGNRVAADLGRCLLQRDCGRVGRNRTLLVVAWSRWLFWITPIDACTSAVVGIDRPLIHHTCWSVGHAPPTLRVHPRV